MSLVIAGIAAYGFGRTIDEKLIHPAIGRPGVLYAHAILFSGWLLFFMVQSALVRTRRVQWHRRLGWLGAGLGVAMFVLGVATAIVMGRFNIAQLHARRPEANLLISFFDITAFAVPLALAIHWRKKPEFHRRLQLMACCALTAAAFGRFPSIFFTPGRKYSPAMLGLVSWATLYLGVDILILLAAVRDLIIERRIHCVHRYGLPAFIVGQAWVIFTIVHHSAWWLTTAHFILR